MSNPIVIAEDQPQLPLEKQRPRQLRETEPNHNVFLVRVYLLYIPIAARLVVAQTQVAIACPLLASSPQESTAKVKAAQRYLWRIQLLQSQETDLALDTM